MNYFAGGLLDSIDSEQRKTEYVYDTPTNPRLPKEIKVSKATTVLRWQKFVYDTNGRTLEETLVDPANGTTVLQKTTRTYYTSGGGAGLIHEIVNIDLNPLGNNSTNTYFYDNFGRVIQTKQSSNFGSCNISHTVYDKMGNVIASICGFDPTYPDDSPEIIFNIDDNPDTLRQKARDLRARVYLATNPDFSQNRTTLHTYDALGRRIETEINAGDAYSQKTRTVYDELGRVKLTITNYKNNQSYAAPENWTFLNSKWQDRQDGEGVDITHGTDYNENILNGTEYNQRGLVQLRRDTLGNAVYFVYDDADRVIKTIVNYVAQGATNPANWAWSESNQRWESSVGTSVVHNSANDQNIITEQFYDAAGNLVQTRDVLGISTFTVYDALNRPKKVVRSANRYATINPNDPNYNIYSDPRLATYDVSFSSDRDLVEKTEYDAMGRVIRTRRLLELVPEKWDVTLFGYDQLGRQVKTVRSANLPEYDIANDPDLSAYSISDAPDVDITTQTVYDAAGRVRFTIDASGTKTWNVYDGLGRQKKTIANCTYVFDPQNPSQPKPEDDNYVGDITNPAADIITETFYDSDGRIQKNRRVIHQNAAGTDLEWLWTFYGYDAQGRQVRTIQNPASLTYFNNPPIDPNLLPAFTSLESYTIADPTKLDQDIITVTIYDDQGRVRKTIDPLGNVALSGYDSTGRRIKTIQNASNPNGTFNEALSNYVPGSTPGADQDRTTTTTYDIVGRVLKTSDTQGNFMLYGYDKAGRRVRTIQNATNPSETFAADLSDYQSLGSPNADQDRILFTRYDLAGRATRNNDVLANTATYFVYDAAGRRTRTINFGGGNVNVAKDWVWNNNKKQWEDGSGNAINHGVNNDSNHISLTVYNKGGQVLSTRDTRGTLSKFVYDASGRRVQVVQAVGTTLEAKSYTCYDKAGRVLRSIENWIDNGVSPDTRTGSVFSFAPTRHGTFNDQNRITVYEYDALSRRTKVTDSVGSINLTNYFKDGQVAAVTDAMTVVTAYRYDGLRRRRVVVQNYVAQGSIDPENWTWSSGAYRYGSTAVDLGTKKDQNIIVQVKQDKAGRILEQRDPRGNLTQYTYDRLGRRTKLTNPLTIDWTTAFINQANGTTSTTMTYPGVKETAGAPVGYTVQRDFDRLGRLTKINYGSPTLTPDVQFVYDEMGNRQKMTEYSGGSFTNPIRETTYGYDSAHRLISVGFNNDGTGAIEETVSYQYDRGGLRTKLTLPGSRDIVYVYDTLGQLVGLTDWDGQQTTMTYDQARRHIGTARSSGMTSDYLYDVGGRLRRINHAERSKILARFAYEVDPRGNRTQAFEQLARPSAIVSTIDKNNAAVTYYRGTWEDSGNFKQTTDFSAALKIPFNGQEAALVVGVGPDYSIFDIYIDGSLWESFDGYKTSVGERIINVHLTKGGSHTLDIRNRREKNVASSSYKLGFRQLVILNTVSDMQTITYTYDAISRIHQGKYYVGTDLTAAPFRSYEYGFDEAGNRISETIDSITTTWTYNAANQMNSAGSSFDLNGNLINDGTNAYLWDRGNRLMSMGGLSYKYDGESNRISQTVGPTVTQYLLDLQPGLVNVLRQSIGGSATHFVHSPRGIHAREASNGDWFWTAQDGLGSVRMEVNNNVNVTGARGFALYGSEFPSVQGGFSEMPFAFTGEIRDGNGLNFHRARYLNTALGDFISLDTYGGIPSIPLSLNRYSWVEGNPINGVDPTGNITISGINSNPPRYSYSCNCGWIDWNHLEKYDLVGFEILDDITAIVNASQSLEGFFYIVDVSTSAGTQIFGPRTQVGVNTLSFLDQQVINLQEYALRVGLSIFMMTAWSEEQAHEVIQSYPLLPNSGFAEEDLISDFLGFYTAYQRFKALPSLVPSSQIYESIKRTCGAFNEAQSEAVYRDNYPEGVEFGWQRWYPRLIRLLDCEGNIDNNSRTQIGSCNRSDAEGYRGFPSIYSLLLSQYISPQFGGPYWMLRDLVNTLYKVPTSSPPAK